MKMKIAGLVEDMTLYPRHAVDTQHVSQIALAISAGAKLPPIIVDRKSKRIVDGFHRCRGLIRVHGKEADVDVELRDYKNEKEIILDAIALNAHHGRRLDRMDQVRAIVMAESVGATKHAISVALSVPEKQVEILRVRIASVAPSSDSAIPHSVPSVMVLKRPVAHLAGKKLTMEQAEAHASMPGTSFALLCNQLIKAMDAELIDPEDETTFAALGELKVALTRYLREAAA